MSEPSQQPALPPSTFPVWTLDETYTPRTQMGGAGTVLEATVIAAAVAQAVRVPVGVLDELGAVVTWIAMVQEET